MLKLGQHDRVIYLNYIIQVLSISLIVYYWNDVSILWFVLGYLFFGFFILDGYLHRYLAHKAYKMSRWTEVLCLFSSTMLMQNSAIAWAGNHITHHKYSDTENDSHPASDWVNTWLCIGTNKSNLNPFVIRNLLKDKLYIFQQKHYFKIFFTILIILYFISPMFTLCFFAINVFFGFHGSNGILNVLAHKIGYRNFDVDDNSKNLNLIVFPGTLHNNHHKYPKSINDSTKWYEIDLTYYFIRLIKTNQH
tara:strand:+ start:274 stop:1020 length:747 start_codon:yes stop_codon:yes gene_type:complete